MFKKQIDTYIPKDWEYKKLSDVSKIIMGQSPDSSSYNEDGIGYPFLQGCSEFGNKYPKHIISCSAPAKIAPQKSILISVRAPVGDINISNITYCIGRGLASIVPDKINDIYLFNYIKLFRDRLERVSQGSTFLAIGSKELTNFELLSPPLPEQQKIAEVLTTIDKVIEKTEQLIKKLKSIKKGLMQDLFTRGVTPDGKLRPIPEDAPELYKESELGLIPMEWKVGTLDNSTDYVDYRGKTPIKSEDGTFLITARNIKDGFIDYENSKEYIPNNTFNTVMSRGKITIGDVIITTEAPLGNVAQCDRDDVALAQRVIKYRGKCDLIINDYLALYLMSDKFQRLLIAESTGSTVLGIKGSRLHRLNICLPSKDEQVRISTIFHKHQSLLKSEESLLKKQYQVKKGLMDDLLTGKVRVTELVEDNPL